MPDNYEILPSIQEILDRPWPQDMIDLCKEIVSTPIVCEECGCTTYQGQINELPLCDHLRKRFIEGGVKFIMGDGSD